eukprot:5292055-Heterocapsa_arctica.AAC.1
MAQGPYIWWSRRRSARVGTHKQTGEIQGSLILHIGTLQQNYRFAVEQHGNNQGYMAYERQNNMIVERKHMQGNNQLNRNAMYFKSG